MRAKLHFYLGNIFSNATGKRIFDYPPAALRVSAQRLSAATFEASNLSLRSGARWNRQKGTSGSARHDRLYSRVGCRRNVRSVEAEEGRDLVPFRLPCSWGAVRTLVVVGTTSRLSPVIAAGRILGKARATATMNVSRLFQPCSASLAARRLRCAWFANSDQADGPNAAARAAGVGTFVLVRRWYVQ